MLRSVAPLLLLFLLAASCHPGRDKEAGHSFYYWKTSYSTDSLDPGRIRKLGVRHFYIHYLDVDWSENGGIPVPKAVLSSYEALPFAKAHYTPVVFITARTFERMSPDWCDSLAAKLTRKIAAQTAGIEERIVSDSMAPIQYGYYEEYQRRIDSVRKLNREGIMMVNEGPHKVDSLTALLRRSRADAAPEIQVDCDWTAGAKDKYFRFLAAFKKLNPGKTISATIRLYPYKYSKKMGVPPVDKGMLMCYNLGAISDAGTRNSVFDPAQLAQYLDVADYPLPLDIAFPVFGWYAWFRGDHFRGIVHSGPELTADTALFKREGSRFALLADTVIKDNYFREGDVLRLEMPDPAELLKAAEMVTSRVPHYGRITFYDWNYPATYTYESVIEEIFHRY